MRFLFLLSLVFATTLHAETGSHGLRLVSRAPQASGDVTAASQATDNSASCLQTTFWVAPTNVLTRQENRLLLQGGCIDLGTGGLIPDCDLALSALPMAFSGGHDHDNPGRGDGWIVSPGTPSCLDGCTEITGGNTGSAGLFDFDYIAPEEGGQITFTMTGSKPGYTIPPLVATIGVAVTPLYELPEVGTGYQFDASTLHDQHHRWGTALFNSLWESVPGRFASLVQEELPPGTAVPVIRSFGTSLVCGGLFDHPGQWQPPHRGHRLGKENDVRHRQMQRQFWALLAGAFRRTCAPITGRPDLQGCIDFLVPEENPEYPGSTHWHASIVVRPARRPR